MININLSHETQKKIKEIFRVWFFNRRSNIQEFYGVIKKDALLKTIIFQNEEKYKLWEDSFTRADQKKEYQIILEEFFFAEFDKDEIRNRYVVESKKLNAETKAFFEEKYRNFRDSQGAKLVRQLNVKVCPYCNRNYIELYNFRDKGGRLKRVFKGDLDHYYSRSTYPHLSLCLFNLVPSCKVCNHEKLDNSLQTFHPYYDFEDNTYKFSLTTLTETDINDVTFEELISDIKNKINDPTFLQGTSDNFKIEITALDDTYKSKIENSKLVFRLEKKYNNSKEYVKELLKKRYVYTDSYAETLSRNFNQVFETPSEVKRVVFSNELNNDGHNERPLSKLTYDILSELNMI